MTSSKDKPKSQEELLVDIMELMSDIHAALYDVNENITELKAAFVQTTNEYTYPNFR